MTFLRTLNYHNIYVGKVLKHHGGMMNAGTSNRSRAVFCRDGCILNNLEELKSCLLHMNQQIYDYHVTSEKMIFITDSECITGTRGSFEIVSASTPSEAAQLIEIFLEPPQKTGIRKIRSVSRPVKRDSVHKSSAAFL